MRIISLKKMLASATLAMLVITTVVIGSERQNSARKLSTSGSGAFKSPCGTLEQVAVQVSNCLRGPVELNAGKNISDPNKGDEVVLEQCARFNETERCARNLSKNCLTGLHKTVVSSLGSAAKRFRTAECKSVATRAKYTDVIKCLINKGKDTQKVLDHATAIGQAIRDSPKYTADQKLTRTCCVLAMISKEQEKIFNSVCPKQTAAILGLVNGMTEDARTTLCLNTKCQGVLDEFSDAKYVPPHNFIQPLIVVLFGLSSE